jgi:hypothetical protein
MGERPDTEDLLAEQARREVLESARAEVAGDEREEREHARRAEKAQYLREALERRAESERDG